ncbi:Transcription elongation factor GreA, partial [termite gut metagenome]
MQHVGISFLLLLIIQRRKTTMAYMSEEGYKKLVEELRVLETVDRLEISRQIAEARDKGDLSENAEYDAAKDAQGMLEMRINKLKTIIADA